MTVIGGGPATRVIGRAHTRRDGKPCNCGCRQVVGYKGYVIERAKLAHTDLAGLVICEFPVPRRKRPVQVAYTLASDNPIFVGGRA